LKTYQIFFLLAGLLLISGSCDRFSQKKPASKSRIEKLLEKGEDYAFDNTIREKYLDSAYIEVSDNKNDSLTRYFYRRITVDYYDISNYNKSLLSSKKVFGLSRQSKDTLGMAKGLHFSGVSFYGKANNDSAFYYYTQAEKLYSNLNDTRTLGEIVLYKAYIYYNIGEYPLCESEAFKALKLLLNENRSSDIYNAYNLIATALDGQNNNSEAIKYFELALTQLEGYKKEGYDDAAIALFRASCYNNMGGVYVKMGRHQQAITIYEDAMKLEGVKAVPSLYAKLLNNLAFAKFKNGDNTGLPTMFFKSLKIRDSLDNTSGIIASNINLGEYFLYNKDTLKAINYLKTAYAEAKAIKSHFDILNSLKMLADIDKKNGSRYKDRYIAVNDSLQDIAKRTRNKFARIEYETDRLENEKEALAKKNSFIIGVSVVVLLFIAAIFIIYYLNSRNKELLLMQEQQKANEEIYQLMFEQQGKIETARTEEKTRIAMELHDGILNNIYAVRLNLEFINKKADDDSIAKRKEYIKELQNVEAEIRGVSHDLSRNALFNQNQSFENMLQFMITSQKNNFETEFEAHVDKTIDWENMTNLCKVNIYRIIQETLQNINKYSRAKHAKVDVVMRELNVGITVSDDGIGFDPEKAKGGIGLKNLRKRAEALNGTLSITSKPGSGSTVEVVFPV
jgi:signal transduction histidine kinase